MSDAAQADAGAELLEADQAHVGGERNRNGFPDLAHPFQIPRRVFQIFKIDAFAHKLTPDTDRALDRPRRVGIPTQRRICESPFQYPQAAISSAGGTRRP